MDFPVPLTRGRLVRRYKRFMADVILDDGETVVTAHCANSGSMKTLLVPDAPVWLSAADDPKRKLKWTWEIIQIGSAFVGVNTGTPNKVVREAIQAGVIPELRGYSRIRSEVPYAGRSRIDILLEDDDRPPCYVEIKNVTMKEGDAPSGAVAFPDAVTARGAKHLEDLAAMVAQGCRSVILYFVQRTDGDRVCLDGQIDPAYVTAFREASAAGVEVVCVGCDVDPARGVSVNRMLPFEAP
ncbi:DNA/RNA nuclease SfsA [Phaeovibrio sulfidiphilus]|uniref:Sugar fermentation stimulation protein homolog n=1 Tax=Phaeovibrio sulfidiphilus TaxID=1220600 RepID=A0A8J7CPM7_9PROT|nr:DNA/RNA nuclease SfsA [Phaeovibrio sulfidiphilus]MBE1237187.1 DNA/RNA nuclease SfsA [Phaeovibrio sulfidiphilus]